MPRGTSSGIAATAVGWLILGCAAASAQESADAQQDTTAAQDLIANPDAILVHPNLIEWTTSPQQDTRAKQDMGTPPEQTAGAKQDAGGPQNAIAQSTNAQPD